MLRRMAFGTLNVASFIITMCHRRPRIWAANDRRVRLENSIFKCYSPEAQRPMPCQRRPKPVTNLLILFRLVFTKIRQFPQFPLNMFVHFKKSNLLGQF